LKGDRGKLTKLKKGLHTQQALHTNILAGPCLAHQNTTSLYSYNQAKSGHG